MADEWKDLEGAELAGFRLERYLAHGGQAAVFVGVNEARRGQRRAIKVVAPHLARDQSFKQRFLEEAEALERLSHMNIVGFRDVRIAPVMRGREALRHGQPFMALELELLEGWTLRELEEGHARPAVEDVLEWCAQVCDGLSAAHAQRVIHRDIKPGNIFVCHDGIVKVIDFGIAQAISRADADSGGRLTKTGHTAGTMLYVAPELWSGEEATAQVDLYALGLTMAQVLLGRHPFVGVDGRYPNDAQIMHGHLMEDLRTKLVQPRLSKPVEDLIVKFCARDPAQRPASAAAAAAAIRAARRTLLSEPGVIEDPLPPLGAGAIYTGVTTRGSSSATIEMPPAEDEGVPPRRWLRIAAASLAVASLIAGVLGVAFLVSVNSRGALTDSDAVPAGMMLVPVPAPLAETEPAPEPAAEPEPAPMTSMGAGSVDDFECPDPVDNALERLALAEDPRFARVAIGFEPSFFQAHQGIVRVARRSSGMLATCVTEAAQLSEATSMVDVEWRVDSNGQVADLRVTASNFAASTVPRCAACLLTTLSFPRPDDPAGTEVSARLEYRSVAAAR